MEILSPLSTLQTGQTQKRLSHFFSVDFVLGYAVRRIIVILRNTFEITKRGNNAPDTQQTDILYLYYVVIVYIFIV